MVYAQYYSFNKLRYLFIAVMMLICVSCASSTPELQTTTGISSLTTTPTLLPTATRSSLSSTLKTVTPTLTIIETKTPINYTSFVYGSLVQLTGIIHQETFAGPPEWESIEKGDQALTYWILHLSTPINVGEGSLDLIDQPEPNVSKVQLILYPEQYPKYKLYLEQQVQVSGKLFHSITGYHFTDVLMQVEKIELIQ